MVALMRSSSWLWNDSWASHDWFQFGGCLEYDNIRHVDMVGNVFSSSISQGSSPGGWSWSYLSVFYWRVISRVICVLNMCRVGVAHLRRIFIRFIIPMFFVDLLLIFCDILYFVLKESSDSPLDESYSSTISSAYFLKSSSSYSYIRSSSSYTKCG